MCPELSSLSFYPLTTYSSHCLLFIDSDHSNLKAASHPRFLSLIPHILNISLSSSFGHPSSFEACVLSGCITAVAFGPFGCLCLSGTTLHSHFLSFPPPLFLSFHVCSCLFKIPPWRHLKFNMFKLKQRISVKVNLPKNACLHFIYTFSS